MTLKTSVAVDNAALDARVAAIGASPKLVLYDDGASGAAIPAAATDAEVGTRLTVITLPATWMQAAANRLADKVAAVFEDLSVDANGTSHYYRLLSNDEATTHLQGTVTLTGGGGDMEVNNTSFAVGQPFTVTTWQLSEGGA